MPPSSIISEPGLEMGVVALRLPSRIDRRQALLGLMATASTLASPVRASAVGVPVPEKSYAAFFLGQGGYWFSWGIPYLASQAQELGMEAEIFEYSAVKEAWKKITRKKKDGYKIALVGYSLGNDDHLAAEISCGRSAARDFRISRSAATIPSRGKTQAVRAVVRPRLPVQCRPAGRL